MFRKHGTKHLASVVTMLLVLACGVCTVDSWNFGRKDTAATCDDPCVPGTEAIMSQKEHGTSHTPVQKDLRWDCDWSTADRICNYNRHWAEHAGYWETTKFLTEATAEQQQGPIKFYDSNTGRLLFQAPVGRSWQDFVDESRRHGWPSFRDQEVNWKYVRVLPNGETVSVDGTHLGHNLPDRSGRRYCINLVSIAGNPSGASSRKR